MDESGDTRALWDEFAPRPEDTYSELQLNSGSRIAVIGGGPAGSFFSYFLLDMAERAGMDILVDMYEPRDYFRPGPASCNNCGGIISESLVQLLAAEGIILPSTIVQRGIDSYVLHTDVGSTRIETPLHEKRIAAIHRGAGPRDIKEVKWGSFDGYLQTLAVDKGARVIQQRVDSINWDGNLPQVKTRMGLPETYDLIAGAVGVNSNTLKLFEGLECGYQSPQTTRTYICEIFLGEQTVQRCLGNSMHVFLLNFPRLEFAALIPKGDYVTVCLLGEEIDKTLVEKFLNTPQVIQCFPDGWTIPKGHCHCAPRINIQGAIQPFADRMVLIGDSGVTRLYKDGIGAAYRTAKAAATTAIFEGISAEDFEKHYWPVCQAIEADNAIGKKIFVLTRQIQKQRFARRIVMRMVSREQRQQGGQRHMSTILWDTFTGSAPYRDIFKRMFSPIFGLTFLQNALLTCARSVYQLPRSIRDAYQQFRNRTVASARPL